MKKASLFLFVFLLGIAVKGFSQTAAPADFFADKWEITITGTPTGNSVLVAELARKDGKISGVLKDPTGTNPNPIPVTKVEEVEGKKLTIYFNTDQAGEIGIALEKVDDDHLKGMLMSMLETTAVRVKK